MSLVEISSLLFRLVVLGIALNGCGQSIAVRATEEPDYAPCAAPFSPEEVSCLEKKVKDGDIRSAYALWVYFARKGQYDLAFPWLHYAADARYPRAVCTVAGVDLFKEDPEVRRRALENTLEIADGGNREAAEVLSDYYSIAWHGDKDAEKAAFWKRKAEKLPNVSQEEERREEEILKSCKKH